LPNKADRFDMDNEADGRAPVSTAVDSGHARFMRSIHSHLNGKAQ